VDLERGDLVRGDVADHQRHVLRDTSNRAFGVRFVPRLAELRDGSEARAFFAADSRRCRFWNPSAADLDLKDLRLRFPLGSNQSA
jgi:hypothetical protein